jgi:rfaE bifunctional protein kinase chain/domain
MKSFMENILQKIQSVKVAVIGDFCLDVYWTADMTKSELSRETPQFPLPIVEERMSPGGAGNVVCNLCALCPASVRCIGDFGKDWRGDVLVRLLQEAGAKTDGIFISDQRKTNTYIKPLKKGISDVIYEAPRLDFTNYKELPKEAEQFIIRQLDAVAKEIDVLCVCDQMPYGCITPAVRQKIIELGRMGLTVIVDSRDRIGLYEDVIVKPNDIEACRALGVKHVTTPEELLPLVRKLATKNHHPAVITAGEAGCVVSSDGVEAEHVPAVQVIGETDICGAGDTFLSAFACAYAAGIPLKEAAAFACKASSIVVKKLKTTGTASPEELLSI